VYSGVGRVAKEGVCEGLNGGVAEEKGVKQTEDYMNKYKCNWRSIAGEAILQHLRAFAEKALASDNWDSDQESPECSEERPACLDAPIGQNTPVSPPAGE
jgi:hypothetical protein